MIPSDIRGKLFELADEHYRQFHSKLVPDTDPEKIIGVRLPKLRALAKEIANGDFRSYLETAQSKYYEEVMLQGMVICYAKTSIEETLHNTAAFVPKIDNWGVCDSFCTGLKAAREHDERVWFFLQPYLQPDPESRKETEYPLRFAVVMLLDHFITEPYIDRVLPLLDQTRHEGYYVKMAIAWALSVCYVKFPDKTMEYLSRNTLDDFTFNKTLQKIMESLRVPQEDKTVIRAMKR